MKVSSDRTAVSSAQAALASAQAVASAARSSAVDYGQGSTFTMLPAVGQVIARGQSLFALGGQPTVLLYGSVVPSRAFVSGMSAGGDVAELNANLEALGYAGGRSGETFSSATEAAIRAFQSARGHDGYGRAAAGLGRVRAGSGACDERDSGSRRKRGAGTGAGGHLDASRRCRSLSAPPSSRA